MYTVYLSCIASKYRRTLKLNNFKIDQLCKFLKAFINTFSMTTNNIFIIGTGKIEILLFYNNNLFRLWNGCIFFVYTQQSFMIEAYSWI